MSSRVSTPAMRTSNTEQRAISQGLRSTAAAGIAALLSAACSPSLDTQMLETFTPASDEALMTADSVALSYLAKGWMLAGDDRQADRLLDELERRGNQSFGIGVEWAPFPPVDETPNPADTVYVVTLVQVADAFRAAGRTQALNNALDVLERIPRAEAGCLAYSEYDVAAGCVHNVNAIGAAFLSRVGADIEGLVQYELESMVEPGAWYYWAEAPEGYWAYRRIEDAGHMAWASFEMMGADDPRLQELGRLAISYIHENRETIVTPYYAEYAVTAAMIRAGMPGGCERAERLPEWAEQVADQDDGEKNRQWAAYVHVWSQTRC